MVVWLLDRSQRFRLQSERGFYRWRSMSTPKKLQRSREAMD